MDEFARVRAQIRIYKSSDIEKFVGQMKAEEDSFLIVDFNGRQRADAKSLLGVMYAVAEFNDQLYLVNETNDGSFPSFIDEYRA